MLILPAIDLMGGVCVRLKQGRFDDVTTYGDPAEQLAAFADAGAEWVHVVDLDGARAGKPMQTELLRRLAAVARVRIQCGGGVREWGHVQTLIDSGVARVVVGSAALRRPNEVAHWLSSFGPERICCAFDVRRGEGGYEVVVDGWATGGGRSLNQALDAYAPGSLKHILVTDVSRDGILGGPNAELIASIAAARPELAVQASGGVASLSDIAALRTTGAAGAIVGRALYERRFSLEDALAG